MAGLIGAAANAGYALVGVIGIGLTSLLSTFEGMLGTIGLSQATVAMLVAHKGWRLMVVGGGFATIECQAQKGVAGVVAELA